jgi:hypothetical protein
MHCPSHGCLQITKHGELTIVFCVAFLFGEMLDIARHGLPGGELHPLCQHGDF